MTGEDAAPAGNVVGQHRYLTCGGANSRYPKREAPSPLDVELARLARLGECVLGFWRASATTWVIKVMA